MNSENPESAPQAVRFQDAQAMYVLYLPYPRVYRARRALSRYASLSTLDPGFTPRPPQPLKTPNANHRPKNRPEAHGATDETKNE